MMRRALLALALLFGFAAPAAAQVVASYGGWVFPSNNIACSPACQGAAADFKIPVSTYRAGIGGQQQYYGWEGINGNSVSCNGCLFQFGIRVAWTNSSTKVIQAWWEIFGTCGICNLPQFVPTGTFAPAELDVVHLDMECTSNCTPGNASQTWSLAVVDRTQNVTCNLDNANGCSGYSFNVPTGLQYVTWAYEPVNGVNDSPTITPMQWSGLRVNQGSGLVIPVFSGGAKYYTLYVHNNSGANEQWATASGLTGNGDQGNMCETMQNGGFPPMCAAAPYSGAATTLGLYLQHRATTLQRLAALTGYAPRP